MHLTLNLICSPIPASSRFAERNPLNTKTVQVSATCTVPTPAVPVPRRSAPHPPPDIGDDAAL